MTKDGKVKRDEFDDKVKRALAERAGQMCSNPNCNHLTAGPCETDPELSTRIGRASHICAASPGGPRYDPQQGETERKSAANGLWLCCSCGDTIDKNDGKDYPAELLHKWKEAHEDMIRFLITSNRSPLPLIRKNSDESEIAQQFVNFIASKGLFYKVFCLENPQYVATSLDRVRCEILKYLDLVQHDSTLHSLLKSFQEECQSFMNDTSCPNQQHLFFDLLSVLRSKSGLILKIMQEQYAVKIDGELAQIIPPQRYSSV